MKDFSITRIFIAVTVVIAGGTFLTIVADNAKADDLYQFALHETEEMTASDCALIERYYDEKTKRLSFSGHVDKNGCSVSMSHKDYEQRFQFCYLAGVVQHKTNTSQSLECFIQKTTSEYVFLAHVGESMWKDSQMACYFTCIGK